MADVSRSVEVDAAPGDVWNVATDPSRFGEWQTIHVGFGGEPPASLETGSEFTQKITIMGMPGEVKWTVESADEPNHLEMSGAGPMGVTATAKLSLDGDGDQTKVTYDTGFDGAAIAPMASTLEAQSAKAAEDSLAKLKELV